MTLPAWYTEWCEAGREFRAGFILLQQHGACSPQTMHLLSGFARGGWVPATEREMLESYLLAAAKAAPTEPKTASEPTVRVVMHDHPTAAPTKKGHEPHEIVALRQSAIPLHKRHSHLHALLTAATTDNARYELAAEIMERVIPPLDRTYDQIREWQRTGTLPSTATVAANGTTSPDGAALMKRLHSLRAQRSRLRKELAAAKTDSERVAKAEEIQKRETEIASVEAQLNGA